MAAPQHLGFQFPPEDRPALMAALDGNPVAARAGEQQGYAYYRLRLDGVECAVEVGDDHGTVTFVPGEADAVASLALEILGEAGAVFAGCC